MKRSAARLGVLAGSLATTVALLGPSAAAAARGATSFTGQSFLPALRSLGAASGTVTAINGSTLTIQTAGRLTGTINALSQSANAVTKGDYPYVWGGGHAQAGIASVGIKGGPGANGKRLGYDCSGAVTAVLAGAGLWPAGAGVPNDAGVISELLQRGLIAKGPGQAPNNVTLYDHPGVHIFMNIAGRFFGTSDGGGGGDAKGGAGWLYDSAYDATDPVFKQYHFVPSVLHDQASFGHIFTFSAGYGSSLLAGLAAGDKVKVSYGQSSAGSMVATAISYRGAVTTTQTIATLAADGTSFTAEGSNGTPVTYQTAGVGALLSGLAPGASVQITYTSRAGVRTARTVKLLAAPTLTQVAGTVTTIATGGTSVTVQATTGQTLTVAAGALQSTIAALTAGTQVQVAYVTLPDGTLVAQSVTGLGTSSTGSGTTTGSGTATTSGTGSYGGYGGGHDGY